MSDKIIKIIEKFGKLIDFNQSSSELVLTRESENMIYAAEFVIDSYNPNAFTIELSVLSKRIKALPKYSYLTSHFNHRIKFHEKNKTLWFDLTQINSVDEFVGLIIADYYLKIQPVLFTFSDTKDLINFWSSGRYDGMSKVEADEIVELYKDKLTL